MKIQKPTSGAEKSTKSTVDTIVFTKKEIEAWKIPAFQRPVRVNEKVKLLAEQIKNDGGVIPGIITFGVIDNKERYLLDGQQRREAFLLAEKEEGYADARFCFFSGGKAWADMAQEFVNLNSHLVNMRPDDILRGLEPSVKALQDIRKACPFVGYDMIRRGDRSPILSMSAVVRSWSSSFSEVPAANGGGGAKLANQMTDQDVSHLTTFLNLAHSAWGRDQEYVRLWNGLNLVLSMWLYRRTVIGSYSASSDRMSNDAFRKCLMALSASEVYVDWLTGRHLGEHDRAPAYNRLKAIFAKRLQEELGKKPKLPAPAWAHG
jgi:hypothetical protein